MSGPFLAVDIGNSAVKVARWDGTWGEVASYKSSVEAPAHVWAPRLASPLGEPLKSVGLRFINRTASYRCHASS